VEGVSQTEALKISRLIDISFMLHIRISDVFRKPDGFREFSSHREQVLEKLLSTVFPEGTQKRRDLRAMFIGDILTVNRFEKELREVFQKSIERIHKKIEALGIDIEKGKTKEFNIWHFYYRKHFKPLPQVIQKSILNHLKTPRGRVQIACLSSGWTFKSFQRESQHGKRFHSSPLDILPDTTVLIEKTPFFKGLVYCVINGYYGIFDKGSLKEHKTVIEFDRQNLDLGTKINNQYAFLRPDQISTVMQRILSNFPQRDVNYLDCIDTKPWIQEVMIFLNLKKFGQLSFIWRDNLATTFVTEVELPEFQMNGERYYKDYSLMLRDGKLLRTVKHFFKEQKIDLKKASFATWVNTNSFKTHHSSTRDSVKEDYLSQEFQKAILA